MIVLLTVVDLFAGAGGFSDGFRKKGYAVLIAVEKNQRVAPTYERNHPYTKLIAEDISNVQSLSIKPDVVIGGPPCQSFSIAGAKKGFADKRGRLVFEYLRVLEKLNPKAFVIENVKNMLSYEEGLKQALSCLENLHYKVSYNILNALDFGLAQDRKRLFIVGIREDIGLVFSFDTVEKTSNRLTLHDVLYDLPPPAKTDQYSSNDPSCLAIPNHEYSSESFSSRYMSRNRRRSWDQPSFTIPATSRHVPIHPSAKPMINIGKDHWMFDESAPYRRLSVRECARIQGFDDDYVFEYSNIRDGYSMVGNAVPPSLSKAIAKAVKPLII